MCEICTFWSFLQWKSVNDVWKLIHLRGTPVPVCGTSVPIPLGYTLKWKPLARPQSTAVAFNNNRDKNFISTLLAKVWLAVRNLITWYFWAIRVYTIPRNFLKNLCVRNLILHRVSKNCAKLVLPELCQISSNFDNFWPKNGNEAKIMRAALIFHLI